MFCKFDRFAKVYKDNVSMLTGIHNSHISL